MQLSKIYKARQVLYKHTEYTQTMTTSEIVTTSNNIKSQDKLQPEEQMERHGMERHADKTVSACRVVQGSWTETE